MPVLGTGTFTVSLVKLKPESFLGDFIAYYLLQFTYHLSSVKARHETTIIIFCSSIVVSGHRPINDVAFVTCDSKSIFE